jgi:hypothetical protein
MAGSPALVAQYRKQRELANKRIPMESGPAREAAANPPVPRAWVDGGAGLEVLIENRPDGVFVTGSRTAGGGEAQMWGSEPLPVESGFILPDSVFATPDDQIPTLNMSDMQQTQTGPDTMTQVMGDVQQGIGETLTGQTLEYGARQAVSGALALASDARDALTSLIPDDVRQTLGIAESVRLEDWVPDMAPPESVTGNIVSALSQFLIPYGAVMKGVSVAGKAATTIGGRSGQAMLGGAAVDFTVWDTQDERFADLVQTIPWAANDITAWLASNEDDSVLEVRLKNSIEGALLGGLVDSIVSAARIYRAGKQMVEGLGPDVMDKLREFGANTDGTVNIPDGMMPPSLRGGDALGDAARVADNLPMDEASRMGIDGTKVVDDSGSPLLVYHGSLKQGLTSLTPGYGEPGTWFSGSINTANNYAKGPDGQIYKAYLNMRNPLVVDFDDDMIPTVRGAPLVDRNGELLETNVDIVTHAENNGYDGVIFSRGNYTEADPAYVVFDSGQVKLLNGGAALPDEVGPLTVEDISGMMGDAPTAPAVPGEAFVPTPAPAPRPDRVATAPVTGSTTDWMVDAPPAIPTEGKRTVLTDVGRFLDEQHVATHGRNLDIANPDDVAVVQQAMADEIKFQLEQEVSGRGWYDDDIASALAVSEEMHPSLAAPIRKVLLTAIAALHSPARRASDNWVDALRNYAHYDETGKLSPKQPGRDVFWPNGTRGPNVAQQITLLNHMIDTLGEEGAMRFMLEPQTVAAINDVRFGSGLYGKGSKVAGKADDTRLGAFIFGEKIGSFFLNLNGVRETTTDIWFTRTWNRHLGRMMTVEDGKPALVGQPRNQAERAAMKEMTARLSEETGLSTQDIQAVLWYYEQNLYTRLGVPSRPASFLDGANNVRSSQPGADAGGKGSPGGGGSRSGAAAGAALVGGSGAAALIGGTGQDALASTGDQYDDQGNLIVNVVPNPDVPTRPGDLTPEQQAGPETQVAGGGADILAAIARAMSGEVETKAAKVLGDALDDATFSDLRSALSSPAMDDIDVAMGAFNFRALDSIANADNLLAAVTNAFRTGIDNQVAAIPRQAYVEMQATLAQMRQRMAELKSPTPPAEIQQFTQAQRDVAEIELAHQIADLEARFARSDKAADGVMTDDTVAWMANASGMTRERLINRETGEAYNAPQLRAARAIVTGAVADLREAHAAALISGSDLDIAVVRRLATITSALLLQYKGATAEAARALGSLRGNAAMPPGGVATSIPDNPLMQAAMMRDFFETSGGRDVNKAFMDLMTKALKSGDDALIAGFTRQAAGASTFDMVHEAWINTILASPATQIVNASGNVGVTATLLTEVWVRSSLDFGGNNRELLDNPGSAMAYSIGLFSAVPDAMRLARDATLGLDYTSKFTTASVGHRASITTENFSQLINRNTGHPIADVIDRTVGQILAGINTVTRGVVGNSVNAVAGVIVDDINMALGRQALESGNPLASLADMLADYYYRGPGRMLGGADEFFKAINYRAELYRRAYIQARAEGLRGAAFKARMEAILADPVNEAPDIHLGALDHGKYATLQMHATPAMRAIGQLRSMTPGGRYIMAFMGVISNIIRVAYHRMPVVGMAAPDNMRRLLSMNATDRQVVAGRQISGALMLGSAGMLAANGYLTGSGTGDYEKDKALEAAGVPPYSINIGALVGLDDYWVSINRFEPISIFFATAADAQRAISNADEEADAAEAAMAGTLAISKYMMDQSVVQGIADFYEAISGTPGDEAGGAERAGRYFARLIASQISALGGPLARGGAFQRNLARAEDPVVRNANPDPNPEPTGWVESPFMLRRFQQIVRQIEAGTPGLSQNLPARYDWLGRQVEIDRPGPDVISPWKAVDSTYDSRVLIEIGIEPSRARNLDLEGLRIGPEGDSATDIPLDQFADFAREVQIGGEMIRLGLVPSLTPRTISGIKLTPEQDSMYAYLRGQGVKIRGDGGYWYALDPSGQRIDIGSPGDPSDPSYVFQDPYVTAPPVGPTPMVPGLDPSKYYTMEEALNAIIQTREYALLSDYTDSDLGRGDDTKKELIQAVIGYYTTGGPFSRSKLGAAQYTLFRMYPDLYREILARKTGMPPELIGPQTQDMSLMGVERR